MHTRLLVRIFIELIPTMANKNRTLNKQKPKTSDPGDWQFQLPRQWQSAIVWSAVAWSGRANLFLCRLSACESKKSGKKEAQNKNQINYKLQ